MTIIIIMGLKMYCDRGMKFYHGFVCNTVTCKIDCIALLLKVQYGMLRMRVFHINLQH